MGEITRKQALHQSLASCGAVVVAFIGLTHEIAGHVIFPWGPDFLGGPVGWHAAGLTAIASGVLLLAGSLRLIQFPVVPVALTVAVASVFFVVVAAVLYRDVHAFAAIGLFASLTTAYFHHAENSAPLASGA